MKIDDIFEGMAGTLKKGFDVTRVFGEPLQVQGTTVIPVARIVLHGGGGGGEGIPPGEKEKQGGGGFGFMGNVTPLGYILLSGGDARWVQIIDWAKVTGYLTLLALILGLRAHRHGFQKKLRKALQKAHHQKPRVSAS